MATQKICLGVEINPDGLKVALVEPGRRNVIKIDAIPTPSNSLEDTSIYTSTISSWARDNLSSLEISSVGVAFPACIGIIRSVNIPKDMPKENAPSYVEWEFISAINSKPNDYSFDSYYYPNEKKPEHATLIAFRKKIVDSFDSLELRKSGFWPAGKELDIIALQNLFESSEGWDSQYRCILKADEKFTIAFWGNEVGPHAIRILPKDCISPNAVLDILESGFSEFPKVKRNVKFCGELSVNTEFTAELVSLAINLKEPIEVQPWNSLPRFSLNKSENFSKLSQCLGAIGATISCI
jgi:hypothetical protein